MTNQASKVIRHLRRAVLLRDGAELNDGELLECFIKHREEAAFAALVKRHGPMVWGVCRRLLDHHDAEDAFQATFLILFRKAASITPREMVGNWLYGVAHQTALQARRTASRRTAREKQVTEMPEPAAAEQDLWDDLRPLLDQELSRLPDTYRSVIVLCDLEGKTRTEAARQLGWPEGTVAGRLARARAMLATRLARHGLVVSGGTLAAVLSEKAASAGVPTSVLSSTIKSASLFAAGQAATGAISTEAVALTEGVLKTMLLNKIKVVTTTLFLIAVLGGGVVGLIRQSRVVAQAETPKQVPVKQASPTQKVDQEQIDRRAAIKKEKQLLQGLWEDCEIEGETYRFDGNTIEWRSKREGTYKWTYRIDLPPTKPPSIDIFTHIDTGPGGTGRGVYELDGDDLTIVYADPRKERAVKFERGGGNTLLVLKRVKGTTHSETPEAKEKGKKESTDTPLLVVHAVLESIDAEKAVITAKCVSGDRAVSVQRLLALAVSDKKPPTAEEIEKATKMAFRMIGESSNLFPKLVNVPVGSDAKIVSGKDTLKLKELQPGHVIALQLATDRTTGLVIVGIRVVDKHANKKP